MTSIIQPLFATLLVSLLSLSGGIILFQKKIFGNGMLQYLVSFAAGVMIGAAFLDLLPEALEETKVPQILQYTLWGIVGSFLFERFILWHHHHEDKHHIKPSAFLILIGDAIHNAVDGIVIAAAFMVNPALGITTTIAIAAHEIPQELADFSVLIYSGFSRSKALLFNFLSAVTALVGTIVGWYFLEQYEELLPPVLAITAGMFIYIACADLIPELHREQKESNHFRHTIPLVIGIIVMMVLTTVAGEH